MKKIILTIMFLLFCNHAVADTIYIKEGDGGSNAGTYANPYNSFEDVTIEAGNDYYLYVGTEATLTTTKIITADGTAENYITIGAYSDGPVLDASGGDLPIINRNSTSGSCLNIQGDYIEVTNIRTEEGETGIYCYYSDYVKVHDCEIGAGANKYGLRLQRCESPEAYDNTIDSEIGTYGQKPAGQELDPGDLWDGINSSSDNAKIYRNTIIDWGHSSIMLTGTSGDHSTGQEVYYNICTGENTSYVRGLDVNYVGSSKVHHNIFRNCNISNQLADDDGIELYYNIFDTIAGEQWWPWTDKHGEGLKIYGTTTINCLVYGNVFYNIALDAILLESTTTITGCEFVNNIIMNWGTGYYGLKVENDENITGNTYKNNQFYTSGETDIAIYKGTPKTEAELNAISANFDANDNDNPDFVNPATHDFTLQGDSPCIDTGLSSIGQDYDDAWDSDSSDPPSTVTTLDQDDYGAGWEKGVYVFAFGIADVWPADDSTGIEVDPTLAWTNPTGTTGVDIYFGTSSPPDLVLSNQAAETDSYTPGTLENSTEYFFRVDIDHSGGTETGAEYSFTTTGTPPDTPPSGYTSGGGSAVFTSNGTKIKRP